MKRSICSAAMLALTALLASAAFAQNPSARTVEVTGHGEAKAKPDTLVVSFFVENQADTADAATAEHAAKVSKLINSLKEKVGSSAKITTADYSLNPTTVFTSAGPVPTLQVATPGPERTEGARWTLGMGLDIRSDSLDGLGRAVDAAIAAGASTQISMSGFEDEPIEENPPKGSGAGGDSVMAAPPRYRGGPPVPMKLVAFIRLGIETQGADVDECMRDANAIRHRIDKEVSTILKGKGGVFPSGLSLVLRQGQPLPSAYGVHMERGTVSQPQVGYSVLSQPQQQPREQKQVYQAHSSVTTETSEIDKLGIIVQTGMNSGATRLNNITFTLSNDNQARKDAIDKASADARSKAQEVARSMGVKLGNVLKISTNAAPRAQVIYGGMYQGSLAAASVPGREASSLPVMPREVGFSAEVSVSYAIE